MRVHWLQHAEQEGLGCIAPWLARRGDRVSCTRLQAGEHLPSPADFDWLIVMGGPMNIYDHERHPWLLQEKALIREAIARDRRVLGLCLGSQLIADQLGAAVSRNRETEIGWFDVELNAAGRAHALFADWPARFGVFHWHGDTFAIPPGARNLAASAACANQAFAHGARVVGLQFHPEVTAADVRLWFEHETPEPGAYVQTAREALADIARFAQINRLMLQLLDRMAEE